MDKARLNSIDVLRGVAALMVVLYHTRAEVWVGTSYFWHNPSLRFSLGALTGYLTIPLSYGFLGVQLLFVISGYCIHRNYAKRLASDPAFTVSWKSYFLRRFWRIYPTLIAAIVLTWFVDSVPVLFARPSPDQSDTFRTALANLFALQGLAAPSFGSDGVLWTLALEIHFYLLYPLLLAIRRKLDPAWTLGLIFLLSFSSAAIVEVFHLKRFFPFWQSGCPIFLVYWFTWVCGFYIAEVEFKAAKLPARLTLFGLMSLLVALGMNKFDLRPLEELPFAIAAASVVAIAVSRASTHHGALSGALQFVGVFSYSLYITHRVFISLLKNEIREVAAPHSSLLMAFVVTAVCVLMSWLFYQLVECWSLRARPLETLFFNFRKKPVAIDPPAVIA